MLKGRSAMLRKFCCVAVAASSLLSPNLAEAQRPAAVQAASEGFVQAAYELGLHLALGESNAVPNAMRETWSRLTRLRNIASPPRLLTAVRAVSSSGRAGLEKRLDAVEAELAPLKDVDVNGARMHLANARRLLEANKMEEMQIECQSVLDSIAGQAIGLDLDVVVDGIRKARKILGSDPTPAKMADARAILRSLPGADGLRQRAFQEGLGSADDLIASAADLYVEYAYRDAAAQLQRARVPMLIAAKASNDPQIARRLDDAFRSFAQADQLIVRNNDWTNNARFEGLRLLRDARGMIRDLQAKDVAKSASPAASPGAPRSPGAPPPAPAPVPAPVPAPK